MQKHGVPPNISTWYYNAKEKNCQFVFVIWEENIIFYEELYL